MKEPDFNEMVRQVQTARGAENEPHTLGDLIVAYHQYNNRDAYKVRLQRMLRRRKRR